MQKSPAGFEINTDAYTEIDIPALWRQRIGQDLFDTFWNSLTPMQKTQCRIAQKMLGCSFFLDQTHMFTLFKNSK